MTSFEIENVTRRVSSQVAGGHAVPPRYPERVPARELTIEYEPEPYPEVNAAFEEFCRITGTEGTLLRYRVGVDGEAAAARVRVTVEVGAETLIANGAGNDVVAASVDAFATAVARAA